LNVHRKPAVWTRALAGFLAIWLVMSMIGSLAASAAEEGQTAAAGGSFTLGGAVAAAILIDAATGQVLYEQNADAPRPPASMTKLMTEYIVLERITKGQMNWTDVVATSKEAASTPPDGSQIYLAEGDEHSVKDLYIAMAVGSANDATIALASHIGGSEAGFVSIMNETAQSLGLETAHFTGATGLQDDTVISARDLAKFASIILRDHPEFLEYSALQNYKFRERDEKPMVNWNWMLGSNKSVTNFKQYAYEGVDGMKTGYISAAGYCFTGTAKRGDMRLISVVMGTESTGARFLETAKLFDYGFNNYESKTIVAPKSVVETVQTVKLKKGVDTEVPVVTDQDVTFLVKKGVEPKIEVVETVITPEKELVAPIAKAQKVGTVTYKYTDENGKELQKTVNLITSEEVKKAGWFKLMLRSIGSFFKGLFNGIVNLF
jgi:serine-type D-Ala-D-Ala carboxypeptidase (penicillin-binding protein 5/6)